MRSQSHRPLRMTPKMPIPRPEVPWWRIGQVALGLFAVGSLGWVGYFYHTHVMPNVVVAGVEVSNTSRAEVERVVDERAAALELQLVSDDTKKLPTLLEVGVDVDKVATVAAVFDARRVQDMPEALALWQVSSIPLHMEVDEQILESYLAANFSDVYKAPTQPDLVYESGQFELLPGREGTGFDVAQIVSEIKARAANPSSITIRASDRAVSPGVTDAAAAVVQEEANKRLWVKLDFLYRDKLIYFPEAPEMAAWYVFEPSRDGTKLTIRYDRARIATFIETRVTDSLNSFFGPEGSDDESDDDYLQVANIDGLVEDMIDAMQARESLEKEIETVTMSAGRQEAGL